MILVTSIPGEFGMPVVTPTKTGCRQVHTSPQNHTKQPDRAPRSLMQNNATVRSAETVLSTSGAGSCKVAATSTYSWISNVDVDEFPALDNRTEVGPTYVLEYSTREAYGET
ncbi:hypothetical protein F5I97DRAFT_1904964 [Phlebopus sp. FC_14]|nr:hypothetical protein F5I97DRAFT_1904964 [Phlebopus sp. FC_14]